MHVTPDLIRKYHNNQCTAEEKKAVENWMREESWPEAFETPAEREEELPKMWELPARAKLLPPYRWAGIAASVLILVAVGTTFFLRRAWQSNPQNQMKSALSEITTANGQTRQVTLEDGTIVHLNVGSSLRFPAHFSDTLRHLILLGEAYFEVAKDTTRPFVIKTSKTETRVLGTRFNLKAYEGESTELVVTEGKVAFLPVADKHYMVILTANERAVLDRDNRIMKDNVYAARHVAWRHNRLVLDDIPLSAIVPILERQFNVRVVVKTLSLTNKHYSGSFESPDLEKLMDDMAYVVGFKYQIRDSTVTITP